MYFSKISKDFKMYFSTLGYLIRSFSSLFFFSLSSAALSAFTAWIDLQWFSATWNLTIIDELPT